MFKRKKLPEPPEAPKLSEMVEDLKTFHIERTVPTRTRTYDSQSSSSSTDLKDWWKLFQTFLYDVDDLKMLKTDVNGLNLKLESSKLEIATLSTNMKSDISESLENTKSDLESIKDNEKDDTIKMTHSEEN